jgi:non-specific serine/threonine protein kinase
VRGAGRLATRQGDYAAAARHVAEELTLSRQLGDEQAIAQATLNAGITARLLDDLDQATSLFHECLERSRELSDLRVLAGATANLGSVAELCGDRKHARRQYMDALRIIRGLGDIGWEAGVLACIGCVCDDYAGARRLFERSLNLMESVGGPRGVAAVLTRWAWTAQQAGHFAEAADLYRRQLALARELRHQQGVAGGLEGVAYAAAATGQPERATQLFAAAQALREMARLALPAQGWKARQQVLDTLHAGLGETAYEELWSEGETMRLDQAIEVALAVGTPAPALDAPPGDLGPPLQDGRLTRREREVAELLSRRLTNRQIAERLVITERTAENHVQRILGKLGFRSRRELAN